MILPGRSSDEEESPPRFVDAEVNELRKDLGLSHFARIHDRHIQDPQRANVIDELAVEAQSGMYLLSPERTEAASRRLEAELKALENQATQQAETRRSNDSNVFGTNAEGKKSIPRRWRAREKWQPLPTSPEVKDRRRLLYEQTLRECGLHLEYDDNGKEQICVTRSPRQKRTRRQQLEGLERLMNPPSKYPVSMPRTRSCGSFVGKMHEPVSHARSSFSGMYEDSADEVISYSTGPGNTEVWPSQPLQGGQLHGKRHVRPSSAATASTEAPTLADDVSDIYSLPSRPGSAPRSRPQSAGPRPSRTRPFSAGARPMPEPEESSMTGSKQRQRPSSAQGALNGHPDSTRGREDSKVTDAVWLRPPGALEGRSAAPWVGRVLLNLDFLNKATSEEDEMDVKPPSPSVCSTDDSDHFESLAQSVQELRVPKPAGKDTDQSKTEMSLRQVLQAAQAGKAPVHITKQIASSVYHGEAAELSPRARSMVLAAALSGSVPVRDKTAAVNKPRAASKVDIGEFVDDQRQKSTEEQGQKSMASGQQRKKAAYKSSNQSHSRIEAQSESAIMSSVLRAPPLAKSTPTMPTHKDIAQQARPWERSRAQAEKPFQEFRQAQKEIRQHEGSVGWQLRNGKNCSEDSKKADVAPAKPGAARKAPEKLWQAGKVWKTAPRAFNLERQRNELLKISQTSSALLQECEAAISAAV